MSKKKVTVPIGFAMVGPDGTEPLRRVAEHAVNVGKAWMQLGVQMSLLADQFDALVDSGTGGPSDAA